MPWTVSSFKSLTFLLLNIYPVLPKDPVSGFNVKIINFPKCNFWLIYINYHCCHRRKISMSVVTHYYMAYFKCVFTRNLSLHTLWSIFCTVWTSRVIKLSATRLLKSSNKFLSIKKQMKGIQMSFPTDWFLKSCAMSAKTSRDEVPEEAAVSSPRYLPSVPDGVQSWGLDSDVPELSLCKDIPSGLVTWLSNLGAERVLL